MKVPHANIDGQVGRNLYEAAPLVDQKYQNYNQKSDQLS